MKNIKVIMITLALSCVLSCKEEINLQIDPWAENIKLIPLGSDFYFVADIVGIPGIDKIVYPGQKDNGSTDITNAICNVDECHTLLVMGDVENTQKFWLAIILQKKDLNGFDNLIHNGKYSFSTPSNRANGTLISFTIENMGEFRTDYLDNNNLKSSNFELTKDDDLFPNQTIECRFNCKLSSFNGQTIFLKNAIWKMII